RVRHLEDGDAVILPEHPVVREEVATDRLRQIARCGSPVRGLFDHPSRDFGLETEQRCKFRHGNLPFRAVCASGATRVSSERGLRAITPLSVITLSAEASRADWPRTPAWNLGVRHEGLKHCLRREGRAITWRRPKAYCRTGKIT